MKMTWKLAMNTTQSKRGAGYGIQLGMMLFCIPVCVPTFAESHWVRHVIHEGEQSMTAVAGDFTGDGLVDVISDSGNVTRLFIAPAWREVILDEHVNCKWYIHSEFFDVDRDGDLDYIAARYNPGRIIWLEQPS
jgi:hypothetical protein